MKKIRTKLLLYFLLISILPIVAVSFLVFQNSQKTIKEQTFKHLYSAIILKDKQIDELIKMQATPLELVAEILDKDLVYGLQSFSIGSEEYEKTYQILVDILDVAVKKNPVFFELFLMEPQEGQVYISTDEKQIGKIKEYQSYFRQGKEATFIKNIYYSLTLDEPAMTISTPVRDEAGNLKAVLAARIKLGLVYEIMKEKVELGETEETYLVNKFNFLVTETGKTVEETEVPAWRRAVYSKAINDCLKKNDGSGSYKNYEGTPVIGAYMWIPEREMCILAEINESEALEPIYKIEKILIIVGILVALIVSVVALFFSSTLSGPLLELVKGTEIISRGNLKHKINIKTKNEIALLASSFNNMAEELQKRQNKLVRTMKKLKELDELKDDFLNTATHELKTPLIPIKAQVELLLDGDYGKLNKEQKDALEMIGRNEEHLNSLVSDVLDITKIKSKKLKLVFKKVNFINFLNKFKESAQLVVKKKNIKIKFKSESILPSVVIDEKRIRQVLENLLDNAIKFTLQGGEIEFDIKKDKNNIVVSVKDNGIGMSKKTLDKLFTPFFQADSDITRKYGGTGLGLSICKGIIEAHGGKVWANSLGLNKGSTLSFSLSIKANKTS